MCALRSYDVVSRCLDLYPSLGSESTSRLPAAARLPNRCSLRSGDRDWGSKKQPESGFRPNPEGARVLSSSAAALARETDQPKLSGGSSDGDEVQIQGTILLQKVNILDINSPRAAIHDAVSELFGNKVKMTLVSTQEDQGSKVGKRTEPASLENWPFTLTAGLPVNDEGISYPIEFSVDKNFGSPGALLVENHHPNEFLLKSVTLHMPDGIDIQFVCNSWVYNTKNYPGPRIFFPNKVYLPSQTPPGIVSLRLEELQNLQGQSDPTGKRQAADRIYDYDVYNDLGDPDKSEDLARPILGGSKDYPYPRRCRTGRSRTETDPASESPPSTLESIYVPRDEQFVHIKGSDFLASAIKSFAHYIVPAIEDLFKDGTSFTSMADIGNLYTQGLKLHYKERTEEEKECQFLDPLELIRVLTDDKTDPSLIKYPIPAIISETKPGLPSDDEFARETLAGMNPLVIERLKVFPPVSSLDPNLYGPQASAMTPQHIEGSLEGLTVQQALDKKRLYMLDYHDLYLPYLQRVNALQGKGYATRSLFFLRDDGTLKPVCIELSLPPPAEGGSSVRRVVTPDGSLEWDLGKTHAIINDMGCHELISHWLRTHGCIEPFAIAFHRNISALHPLHALLTPHFRDTMNINSVARQALINCDSGALVGGIIEKSFTPNKYCMEMSSVAYKSWRFDEQGVPADLIKRGMAETDPSAEHGLKLFVEDYPYAVDALQIWSAIEGWVSDYLAHCYVDDAAIREDTELQNFWKEIRELGHGDKREESWWVSMQTVEELRDVLVTLIWLTSGHHASVNFGQYGYAGYMPNRPTMGRRLIPEKDTPEFTEMQADPEKFYLEMVSNMAQATIVMTTVEILSLHSSDEEYLGQRNTPNWTSDESILRAFARFGEKLSEIETQIKARNENPSLKNRAGPGRTSYRLLLPTSKDGITGRGIPNSVAI